MGTRERVGHGESGAMTRRDEELAGAAPSASLPAGTLAQIACILEVCAPKPGNVHAGASFAQHDWIDFLLAAAAIAPILDRAAERRLGDTVLDAVRASRAVVRGNVNLGIVLLLAPLAAVPRDVDLRRGIRERLADLDPTDAARVYEAILLAGPAGLGEVEEHDLRGPPPRSLVSAMRLAADRDLVARQYANGFADVLDVAVPLLEAALRDGAETSRAIVRLQLELLSRWPDSLIARRCGGEVAEEASRRAAAVLAAISAGEARAAALLDELDGWLRADGSRRNPGTTADLIAATLFVALRQGTLALPRTGAEQRGA